MLAKLLPTCIILLVLRKNRLTMIISVPQTEEALYELIVNTGDFNTH